MNKILVFDNYDSFTYNLVHLIEKVSHDVVVEVFRNEKISLDEIEKYDRIVISPGPGIPEEAGLLLEVIKRFKGKKPIFGVCLGQQAIAVEAGAKLINLDKVFHGVATDMHSINSGGVILNGIETPFLAGRYHSWVIDEKTLPVEYVITARDADGNIMAIENRSEKIYGVQFHPESIMTPSGESIMLNFLNS